MHKWDSIANYSGCFYHVTNVFSKGTQFAQTLDYRSIWTPFQHALGKTYTFPNNISMGSCLSANTEKLKVA